MLYIMYNVFSSFLFCYINFYYCKKTKIMKRGKEYLNLTRQLIVNPAIQVIIYLFNLFLSVIFYPKPNYTKMAYLRQIMFFVCCCLYISLVLAQDEFYSDVFGGFGGVGSARDARQNTGPVLFPPTRVDNNNGGVVVGASGYGFVPPGSGQRVPSQGRGPSFYPGLPFY
uniref:Transmembrane protein n=1 Tax=Cacopsylla melanoneura TaxID=428564 RepID=A0A8D8YD64_9HEMI